MKLATLKDGTRDGQLAVVSRDLKTAHLADGIASTLQKALDDWTFIAPQLDLLYQTINSGRGLIDLCDDITSGYMMGVCSAIDARQKQRVRAQTTGKLSEG